MICEYCGYKNPEGALVCLACNADLVTPSASKPALMEVLVENENEPLPAESELSDIETPDLSETDLSAESLEEAPVVPMIEVEAETVQEFSEPEPASVGPESTPAEEWVSPGIFKGKDGVMRLVYAVNMWKNPQIILSVWKVLLLASLFPTLLVFLLSLEDGLNEALLQSLKVGAMVVGIITVLMLLAYVLVSLVNGGKYCVAFEMDENSLRHIQMRPQFKKNQVLAMITTAAGVLSGSAAAVGAGLMAGSRQVLVSSFDKVKRITVNEKRGVILLNAGMSRNQIYVEPEDFGFVRDYIISHCKKVRVNYL